MTTDDKFSKDLLFSIADLYRSGQIIIGKYIGQILFDAMMETKELELEIEFNDDATIAQVNKINVLELYKIATGKVFDEKDCTLSFNYHPDKMLLLSPKELHLRDKIRAGEIMLGVFVDLDCEGEEGKGHPVLIDRLLILRKPIPYEESIKVYEHKLIKKLDELQKFWYKEN